MRKNKVWFGKMKVNRILSFKVSLIAVVIIFSLLSQLFIPVSPTIGAGAKLTLIAAFIESKDIPFPVNNLRRVTNNKKIDIPYRIINESEHDQRNSAYLSFYIPKVNKENKVELKVFNSEKDYQMIPLNKAFKQGFYTFYWSQNDLNKLNLQLADLNAIGFITESGLSPYEFPYVIPVILHESSLPTTIKVETYSFVFWARLEGTAFIRIYNSLTNEVLFETKSEQILKDTPFLIQWELEKSLVREIPDGLLYLSITFQSRARDGEDYRINSNYFFYNQNHLNTKDGKIFSGPRKEGVLTIYDLI